MLTDAHAVHLPGAELDYLPDLFGAAEARDLFARLREETSWTQHRVRIHGREIPCPRLSAWCGDPGVCYRYSGLSHTAAGWPDAVQTVRARVEAACGHRFNSVLLNLYRSGDDTMGWHADDEPELGAAPVIASVSFGARRKFKLKSRRKLPVPGTGTDGGAGPEHGAARRAHAALDLELDSGSLLLMRGATQHNYRHCLPRTRRVAGARINLTFRSILDPGMLPA